jgi:hypothetical protein
VLIGTILFVTLFAFLPLLASWAGEPSLLGDRHKEKGIECAGCHQENPPKEKVTTARCGACHKEQLKPSGSTKEEKADPHDNHMGLSECGICHHAHKPSEDQCKSCHDFGFKIP